MQLALGQRQALTVGDLPRTVAEYLRCHPAIVYLGHRELKKIFDKHGEIAVAQFQQLPFAISKGKYLYDAKRRQSVTILYKSPDDNLIYLAGLKATDSGREVWVSTYHRISELKALKREQEHGVLLAPRS
jgi:hypothetical protein